MYTERENKDKEQNRRMEILIWHEIKNPEWWLKKLAQCDWTAGQYLFRLLSENRFRKEFGENAEVLLLTDGANLASFCTYAAKDDIPGTDLTPWIGFVYTDPAYRGRRLMGKLIAKAGEMAREDGYDAIWISTREEGLYEKYGAKKATVMKDSSGEDSDIFRLDTYGFAGWERADVPAVNAEYAGIQTPKDLYNALWHVWCAETCAPRMRKDWSEDDRTLGQCSVTAFLAQDIFGGKVYGIPLEDGGFHCYNAVGDCVFDLTSEQFGDRTFRYEKNPEQLRYVHFRKEEKRARYELLRVKLKAFTEGKTGEN